MNRSCSRKLSRSSSSLKPPKADKTIELIKEIISNVSPLKISDIIREAIEPSVSIFEQQDLENIPSMRKSRKSKSSKKQAESQKKGKEIEKEQQEVNKRRRKIKLVKKEAELVCIPREEFEKEAPITRIHDVMNKRKKYSTTSKESSFQCSPIKESSISGYTVMISDDEEENEKEPVKKLKISSFLTTATTDSKEQVGIDMQKEFGNTLSELGERLNNLTNLGNSMKTLSFLKQSSVQKDNQQQQQHEPLEILNDFYSKVKQLYVDFGEDLNQSK